jgi:hypothetical protein
MPQAFADPYSAFAGGLTAGSQVGANIYGMMQQKAEGKARKEYESAMFNLKMASDENLPESDRLNFMNNVIEYSNKVSGTKMPTITSLENIEAKKMKPLLKIGENKDIPIGKRINMMRKKAVELGIGESAFKPLVTGLQQEQRRGILYEPDKPGLPEERAEIKTELAGTVGLTRPEIPARPGGLTPEGEKLDPFQRQEFVETGKAPKKGQVSKTSANTSYLPTGDGKFQLMSVPREGGEVEPVTRNGKPVILSEKQVLIAEGKKAQSLINPYATKFLGELGESEGKRITELKTRAVDSVASKKIIAEARSLLDQGIYTGTAANIRKNFDKLLQEGNIYIGGRKAANTEAYASMMGLQVGKIIKQFGAGTGLSDADREYAEKIVGGRVTLTEDAIRRLLDINERLADFTISEFNSQAERAKRDIREKDYLSPIDEEPLPSTATTPAAKRLKFNPATGEIE